MFELAIKLFLIVFNIIYFCQTTLWRRIITFTLFQNICISSAKTNDDNITIDRKYFKLLKAHICNIENNMIFLGQTSSCLWQLYFYFYSSTCLCLVRSFVHYKLVSRNTATSRKGRCPAWHHNAIILYTSGMSCCSFIFQHGNSSFKF